MIRRPGAAVHAGRAIAFVAVVLLAANLRTAVGAMSPIFDRIGDDVAVTAIAIGLLGMVPPLMFSLTGLLSPRLARATGLEWALVLACAAMVIGPALRAVAADASMLAAGTVVALAGAGVGSILVPSSVKKYFPDRIGGMTAAYATIMSVGAAISPLVAVPATDAVGWRGWLLAGGLVAAVCAIPWVVLALRHRRDLRTGDAVAAVHTPLPASILRSGTAWTIAVAHFVPTMCAYAMFAWLPTIMRDIAGVSAAEGGAMLSLFAIMGLPAAVLGPVLGARGWTSPIIGGGVAAFVLGFGGMRRPDRGAVALGRAHRARPVLLPVHPRAVRVAYPQPSGRRCALGVRADDRLLRRRGRPAARRCAARGRRRVDDPVGRAAGDLAGERRSGHPAATTGHHRGGARRSRVAPGVIARERVGRAAKYWC